MSARGNVVFALLTLFAGLLLGAGSTDVNRFGENGEDQYGSNGPPDVPDLQEEISHTSFNFFDGELLEAVSKQQGDNFVISPSSVKTLIGVLYEAADGRTLEEIINALRLPNDTAKAHELLGSLQAVLQKMETSEVTVDSETRAFLSNEMMFNKTFVKSIANWYKSTVGNEDFKKPDVAANKINSWVNTQTRGKITSLVEPAQIRPDTKAILVNAVYFDAKWMKEFLLKNTKYDECFYSEPNLTCNKVPIMYKKELMNYKFLKEFNSHIVQIPYKDERFSMVLVVPVAVDGMRRLVRDADKLTFPILLDRTVPTEVHLKLPRFSVEYQSDLTQTLAKVGLNTVFTEDAKLPFMIDGVQGRISSVVHKAKIDVSEKGTKAAAVTGAEIVPLMQTEDQVVVRADRPFFFFIYEEESRSVLFSGRISSLTGESVGDEVTKNDDISPLTGGGSGKPSNSQVASYSGGTGKPTYSQVAGSSGGTGKPTNSQVLGPAGEYGNPTNSQVGSSAGGTGKPINSHMGGSGNPSNSEALNIENAPFPQRRHPPSSSDVHYMGSSNGQYDVKPTTRPPPSVMQTSAWQHIDNTDNMDPEEFLQHRTDKLKNKKTPSHKML